MDSQSVRPGWAEKNLVDGWLPIDSCSRRIVPRLERAGYEVSYREFEDGHVVPPAVAREAATRFATRG